MNSARLSRAIALALCSGGFFQSAIAVTLRIQPSADTTLIEIAPDNNMGGTQFVNAGTAGANGGKNRGLYKFDFASIPAGSKIRSALVTLEATGVPDGGGESSTFTMHRVLQPWGEGDKDTTFLGGPGLGLPASTNEATWNARLAFTTNWTSPGASNDFSTEISSSATVYGVEIFPEFASTPQMISDVRTWVDNPDLNFGWLLKTEAESTARTARRFGSREFVGIDTNSPPYVEVEFVAPPIVSGTQVTNGQLGFSFLTESNQAYVVEFKNALSTNSWLALTNIGASPVPATIFVSDPISTNARFYRIVAP